MNLTIGFGFTGFDFDLAGAGFFGSDHSIYIDGSDGGGRTGKGRVA